MLASCSLAMCGLRTRPRTDGDPPRVGLPSAGGISPPPSSPAAVAITCYIVKYLWSNFLYLRHFNIDYFTLHYVTLHYRSPGVAALRNGDATSPLTGCCCCCQCADDDDVDGA